MAITADFHLHTSFSGDSDTPMEEMILRGIGLGLNEMCFTEHNDFDYPVSPSEPEGFFELNPDAFLCEFLKLRDKYTSRIHLRFGAEIGLQPHLAQRNSAFAKAHDYDFIIGSSHLCHGKDPYYPSFYESRSQEDAYREYFESILENLSVYSDFDVYGHLDYVVRYGPKKDEGYSYKMYQEVFDEILKRIVDMKKGIELNTAGLAKGLREPNPCAAVLKRYRELGGEIVTGGSDAHAPGQIAHAFGQACEILKECGFGYYATYKKRKPIYHAI